MIWVETIINGVLYGGLYGLLGVGLALIVGVMRVVNLSHGEFIVLSAFIGVSLIGVVPWLHPLLILALSVALFTALQLLLTRTRFGRIVRATADHRDVVRLMGVNPGRVYNLVMGLSLALASVAGMLLAIRASFTPYSGVERLLIAFEVVVLGGLGTFWGAMLGGITLGVAELVGLRLDPNAGPLYAHLLFLVGVLLRPNGLFRART